MKELLSNKLTLVWALLCAGALVSQLLGDTAADPATTQQTLGIAILVIAFVKAHLVLHYFMGLNRAPLGWRALFAGWGVTVAALLIALYSF